MRTKTRTVSAIDVTKLKARGGVIRISNKDLTDTILSIPHNRVEVWFINCKLEGASLHTAATSTIWVRRGCTLNRDTDIFSSVTFSGEVDINGADLDYCSIPLSCRGLGWKDSSNRLFRQLLYHALSINCEAARRLSRVKAVTKAANKFHRFSECEDNKDCRIVPTPPTSDRTRYSIRSFKQALRRSQDTDYVFNDKNFEASPLFDTVFVHSPADRVVMTFNNCDISTLKMYAQRHYDAVLLCGGTKLSSKTRLHGGFKLEVWPGVDLNGADVDHSWLRLCCDSVGIADSSNRLFYQLLYHAMSVDCEEAMALRELVAVARACKRFHRFGECENQHSLFTKR